MVGGGGTSSESYGSRLQCALDGEELVADLLPVEVLDDIVCQPDVLVLAEGVALQHDRSKSISRDMHEGTQRGTLAVANSEEYLMCHKQREKPKKTRPTVLPMHAEVVVERMHAKSAL